MSANTNIIDDEYYDINSNSDSDNDSIDESNSNNDEVFLVKDSHDEILQRFTQVITRNSKHKKIKLAKRKIDERIDEMKNKQLDDVCDERLMRTVDFTKVAKFTTNSIFSKEKCSLWTGDITKKGNYVNFYFKDQKKVALHRLLYANFRGPVIDGEDYIKYSCNNGSVCCNVNHMVKNKYQKKKKMNKKYKHKEKPKKPKFKFVIG